MDRKKIKAILILILVIVSCGYVYHFSKPKAVRWLMQNVLVSIGEYGTDITVKNNSDYYIRGVKGTVMEYDARDGQHHLLFGHPAMRLTIDIGPQQTQHYKGYGNGNNSYLWKWDKNEFYGKSLDEFRFKEEDLPKSYTQIMCFEIDPYDQTTNTQHVRLKNTSYKVIKIVPYYIKDNSGSVSRNMSEVEIKPGESYEFDVNGEHTPDDFIYTQPV